VIRYLPLQVKISLWTARTSPEKNGQSVACIVSLTQSLWPAVSSAPLYLLGYVARVWLVEGCLSFPYLFCISWFLWIHNSNRKMFSIISSFSYGSRELSKWRCLL